MCDSSSSTRRVNPITYSSFISFAFDSSTCSHLGVSRTIPFFFWTNYNKRCRIATRYTSLKKDFAFIALMKGSGRRHYYIGSVFFACNTGLKNDVMNLTSSTPLAIKRKKLWIQQPARHIVNIMWNAKSRHLLKHSNNNYYRHLSWFIIAFILRCETCCRFECRFCEFAWAMGDRVRWGYCSCRSGESESFAFEPYDWWMRLASD